MTKFKKLIVKNFLGFGEIPVEFALDVEGTTMIFGHNGAGKTSLLNAIVYALYDKPLNNSAQRKDMLINNINKKGLEVVLEFVKDNINYKITRARKMKTGAAGNYVLIERNGKDITPDSISNGNKLVESIIDIPYDLFIRIATISAIYTPFLELPVKAAGACQTDIIEELFDLTSLTTKANILKDQIKESKHALDMQHSKREALENERDRHANQIKSAKLRKSRWEDEAANELASLSKMLKHAQEIDTDSEKEIFDSIKALKDELNELNPARKEINTILREQKSVKSATEKEMVHLESGNCPYCKQSMDTAKEKVVSSQKILDACAIAIAEYNEQITELDDEIKKLDREIDKLSDNLSVSNVEDLYKVASKIDKYTSKIKLLESQENPHIETLDELLEINNVGEFDMESINELEDLLRHQNMVLKLLTKKDSFVRKNLINKSIPYLNKRLNHYLRELSLPQTIEFKHDMTATVSKFGRELDFGNLSNGQKARANLAMSFAFRDVLQNLHGAINICMLDEVLDIGLDAEGVGYAADMLKSKGAEEGISIYVISHRNEIDGVFDREIKIELVDNFTTIKYIDN